MEGEKIDTNTVSSEGKHMSRLRSALVASLTMITLFTTAEADGGPIVLDFTNLSAATDVGRDYTYIEDGVIGNMNGAVREWHPGIPELLANTADMALFSAGGFASFALVTGGDFSLISADMIPWANDISGPALWKGYFGDMLVATETVSTFGTFAFGDPWTQVDRVTVEFIQIGYLPPGAVWPRAFTIDNLTLDEVPAQVPEPSTLTLLGLGLAAAAARRRQAARPRV